MPGWTLIDTNPILGRTFRRPLDATEQIFFWADLLDGSTNCIRHYVLRLSNGPRDAHLFSEANIVRAWLSTKRRYPLSGAIVQGANGPLHHWDEGNLDAKSGDDSVTGTSKLKPHFVVRERDFTVIRPGEIVFGHVNCSEEVEKQKVAILDGPRPLSEERLVRLYVFRETGPERTEVLHLMALMAHCVMDGTSVVTFMRCLLDTLARTNLEPIQIPLEDRLAMAIPSTELQPEHLRSFSLAKRRWRRAVATVILQLRTARRQGGHTLPCRVTRSTPHAAARSGHVSIQLTQTQSAAVISNCRLQKITFGNAFLPLAQVAMTRVLYKRFLHSEITEEEWAYRKRQPHLIVSPLNLRPYLDKGWFELGGGGEFVLSIGFSTYRLPFMTLGSVERQHERGYAEQGEGCTSLGEVPPFSEFLTFDRFLHRARLIKKQTAAFVNHPLFFEIGHAERQLYVERFRLDALRWMKHTNGNGKHGSSDDSDTVLSVMDMPMVFAHGGSNFGNVDLILPLEYPLPPSNRLSPYATVSHPSKAGYVTPPSAASTSDVDTAPKITLEYAHARLHARPGELYLGAASWRGQLQLYIYYDENVYEEGVVREWLGEMRDALLWYLGG